MCSSHMFRYLAALCHAIGTNRHDGFFAAYSRSAGKELLRLELIAIGGNWHALRNSL